MSFIVELFHDRTFIKLFLVWLVIVTAFVVSLRFAFGAEPQPELKCLVFQSNKLVVITVGSIVSAGYSEESRNCDGHAETISYFLYKGYNINAVSNLEVYLTK